MTEADRKITKEMIIDVLAPLVTKIEGRDILMNTTLNNMDSHLEKIDKHLEQLNSKVAEHERVINTVGEERIKGCVQAVIIRELRDNMISKKGVVTAIIGGIGAGSGIVAIVYGVYRLIVGV